MKIHVLGICGTFMGSLALIAKEMGHQVTGSDQNIYPPMSDQLKNNGIDIYEGYHAEHFAGKVDIVIIGNALSRGNEAVEAILNQQIPYLSGPQWLADHVLKHRWVIAVSGTHGKTTTTSMIAWILEKSGLKPGFLIGGVPNNFNCSARVGENPYFVIEADEYDTAFFDKRSKFIHYHPKTLIINNLEYDHADIFPDLAAIQKQFHHLVRIVPSNGLIISPLAESSIESVIQQGCWTPRSLIHPTSGQAEWSFHDLSEEGSQFEILHHAKVKGVVDWQLNGKHNQFNALAAVAACHHIGLDAGKSIAALNVFSSIKRRMELKANINNIKIFDDFAHHPTAIKLTLDGMKKAYPAQRIIAVLELRSNTMRMGVHKDQLAQSLKMANIVFMLEPENLDWQMKTVVDNINGECYLLRHVEAIVDEIVKIAKSGDLIIIMSNGGFGGIHERLMDALSL